MRVSYKEHTTQFTKVDILTQLGILGGCSQILAFICTFVTSICGSKLVMWGGINKQGMLNKSPDYLELNQ